MNGEIDFHTALRERVAMLKGLDISALERTWAATWPGPNPGVAAASFEDRSGTHPNVAFQGPWALFRLFDQGNLQQAGSAERYQLTFHSGDRQAVFELRAGSVLNPFAQGVLQEFRCPTL